MREADAQTRSPESLAPKPSADPRDDGSQDASSSGQWGHELQLSDHHDLEAGQKIVEPQKINRNYRKSLPVEPPAESDSSLQRDPLELWLIGAQPYMAAAMRETMSALDETEQQLLLLYSQDFTDAEIAKQLNLEPRAVHRKIKIIGEKWTEKSD